MKSSLLLSVFLIGGALTATSPQDRASEVSSPVLSDFVELSACPQDVVAQEQKEEAVVDEPKKEEVSQNEKEAKNSEIMQK